MCALLPLAPALRAGRGSSARSASVRSGPCARLVEVPLWGAAQEPGRRRKGRQGGARGGTEWQRLVSELSPLHERMREQEAE